VRRPLYELKAPLERLYRTYDTRYLDSDPLGIVRRFSRPGDREVAGLIAAVYAYGRVGQIRGTLRRIFEPMGENPRRFILRFDCRRDGHLFEGILHRFNRGEDLLCLLLALNRILRQYGSILAFFLEGQTEGEQDIQASLASFVERIHALDYTPIYGTRGVPDPVGFRFLLPSPRKGSACKRLNMFLRWMVRRDDGIDLGLWKEVSPARLVIPLDTHVSRIARRLGLLTRCSVDWRAAVEVTERLKLLDPEDPVKYDFSLARLGILNQCRKEKDPSVCSDCQLLQYCCY